MIVGTISESIEAGITPSDIDVAKAHTGNGYQGYMMTDTLVNSLFSNVPSGTNSWRWTSCTGDVHYLCGADLNGVDGGDPSDPYAIIEVCRQASNGDYVPWVYLDDFALVIY